MILNWRHDAGQRNGQSLHVARATMLEAKVKGLELALMECQNALSTVYEALMKLEAEYKYPMGAP